MCGVAGVLRLDGAPADAADVRRMLPSLRHRGPDGEGLVALGPAVLGHRRLKILDLSERGAQPMSLPDAPLTIAYNGEVYNYVELRDELRAHGATFRSESDTEVVLRAYARWGLDAFERLNGMWALALWDARERRLVLARDRFGIKPLYLLEDGGRLLFASEVKALLRAVPGAREVDRGVLGRFLLGGAQDEGGRTFFLRVEQLRPGRVLALDVPSGRRAERALFRHAPEEARARYDYRDPAATLRGLLADAVRLQLRSDVPVGTCLSGGLDSSAIVALAAPHTQGPVRTFTAVYDDAGYDERRYARAVVARHGCEAHEVRPRPGRALVPLLDRIGWYHDEPCSRPGLITQWYVMALAAPHVRVLLDGQGGDELLLGYAAYALPYLRSLGREALRHPGAGLGLKLLRDARGLLAQRSTSSGGSGPLLAHLVRAVVSRLRRRREPPPLAPDLLRAAAEFGAASGASGPEHEPPARGTAPIDRALLDDLTHASIPALLHHEDRTSMAFSIEARVPFLDLRVVDFALGLRFTEKVDGGRTKAVLRRALRDVLPSEVLERRDKLGYPTPVGRWLREGGADVREVLLGGFAERGLVPARTVELAWERFERGARAADPWRLYRWLTTELWLARFVDRSPAAPPPPLPGTPEAGLPAPAVAAG